MATVTQQYEFTPPVDYNTSRRSPRRWLLSHLRRHWILILFGLTFQVVNITLQSTVPGIIGEMVAAQAENGLDTALITSSGITILVILVIAALVQFLRGASFEFVGAKLERDARDELYASLLGKSQTFHDRQKIGDIMSRVTLDVRQLNLLVNPGVNLIFMAFTFGLVPIIFIGFIEPQLLIIPSIFFITLIYLAKRYNDLLTPWSLKSRIMLSRISSRLNEVVTGIQLVRGSSEEKREEDIFENNIESYYQAEAGLGRARARYWPTLTYGLAVTLSILHGIILLNVGTIVLAELIEFILLFQLVFLAVLLNSFAISAVSMGLAASQRIFDIIVGESRIDLNEDGYAEEIEGNVEFSDVTFGYAPDTPVLKNISLTINPGQTVAIVGMTGSGKTTMTKLLGRIYDPQEGQITIDGVHLREWSIEALRKQFAVVEQDIFLFSRTIRENITFGLVNVPEEHIIDAAKLANAHQFIEELADGYDTVIGERGTTLSGGQRQRIAIARAIIRNPRILILDDASSAIDSKTEDEINTAISNVLQNRVAFIITHRIAQIRKADRIVLLDKGRIAAQGDHQYLLKHSPMYREIFSVYEEED